jgi:[acyl-carrier-protein] S-malonyltransferase
MTLAILCSGQGGQHASMFELTGDAPEAASLFVHATALLGKDPRSWVRSAEHAALFENRTAQMLCVLQALCAASVFADVLPQRRCLAGYSVGEVAAWGVGGLIDGSRTLDLVAARAEAMDAANQGDEGMLFIRGLDLAAIDSLCANREAAIAIVNPGYAYVLGGRRPALAAIAAEALRLGATRAVAISVEVASHTYLMKAASAAFLHEMVNMRLESAPRTGVRIFSGVDGASVLDARNDAVKLAAQISHPIRWDSCLESCVEAGAVAFLELGPGRALVEMAALAYPGIPARSVDDFRSIEGVRTWLSRVINRT